MTNPLTRFDLADDDAWWFYSANEADLIAFLTDPARWARDHAGTNLTDSYVIQLETESGGDGDHLFLIQGAESIQGKDRFTPFITVRPNTTNIVNFFLDRFGIASDTKEANFRKLSDAYWAEVDKAFPDPLRLDFVYEGKEGSNDSGRVYTHLELGPDPAKVAILRIATMLAPQGLGAWMEKHTAMSRRTISRGGTAGEVRAGSDRKEKFRSEGVLKVTIKAERAGPSCNTGFHLETCNSNLASYVGDPASTDPTIHLLDVIDKPYCKPD